MAVVAAVGVSWMHRVMYHVEDLSVVSEGSMADQMLPQPVMTMLDLLMT